MRVRYQRGPAGRGGAAGRVSGWSWRVIVSIRRAYGATAHGGRDPLGDGSVALMAAVTAVAASRGDAIVGFACGAIVAALTLAGGGRGRVRLAGLLLVLAGLAGVQGQRAAAGLEPDALGSFEGWARVVDDPQPYAGSTRVVLDVGGERYEMWARGRARRSRVESWRGGEQVLVQGERVALGDERRARVAWQHVVGEFQLEWVADRSGGGPVDRASNRVRAAIERGAAVLPGDDGALFRGLVVGDDRDQPREMIDRFRASGLSHLTAVSGQNVAFVLAAAGPLLRVLRPWVRWVVTLGLIGWFVSLTRFEPSIVRAGAMAALSATGFWLGRDRSPSRLLGWAVTGLVVVDPLLVRSVGFWLSVGATAGVAVVGPWLAARLAWLGRLATPLGVTLGAQVGVVVPAVWVFGRLPLVAVPANVVAVPVAGFVMLYGLPAGLVAGLVPSAAPVVMWPCRVGVRWVDTVAVVAERAEPGGAATWVGWGVLAVAVIVVAAVRRPAMNQDRHGDPPADR